MRRTIFVVAAVLTLLFAMNATASMITFVETGTASGRYYGTKFTNLPFTITATADTDRRYWDPWLGDPRGWEVDCATAFITIGDFQPVSFGAGYTQFMILNDLKTVFFNVSGRDAWTFLTGPVSDAFATWDMTTSLGPITGKGHGGIKFPVYSALADSISVKINGRTTFSATVEEMPSVPEPGTLALVGAGIFGLAVYRKRMKKA